MNKIIITALILSGFSFFCRSNAINNYCQREKSNKNSLNSIMIHSDKPMFDLDDSLLIMSFPEIGIKSHMKLDVRTSFSHSMQFHCTPNSTEHKNYLIICKELLFNSMSSDIIRYAEDVHAIYGYGVIIETISNETPEEVKSLIITYQSNLCGVLLIGNIGAAMYETSNDHNQYGYRYWPCDLFYMDLNGIWGDSDNNGRYDSHTGNTSPEIFVGRLSATEMSSIGSEVNLIKMQL